VDTSLWTRGAGTDSVDGGADADLQRATGTANADAFVLAQDGAAG
jgi:hypothetical protein